MKRLGSVLLLVLSVSCAAGCTPSVMDTVLDANRPTQVQLRQIQTRYFDIANKKKTMGAVIATLQDLGFIIDKASLELGTVTGTKVDGYVLKMTVKVTPRGSKQMTVRANAQCDLYSVENPLTYQSFFDALAKSLFLQAHMEE